MEEMTMATIERLIGTLGVPLVLLGVIFWLLIKYTPRALDNIGILAKAIQANTEMTEKQYKEANSVKDKLEEVISQLDKNTAAIACNQEEHDEIIGLLQEIRRKLDIAA